VCARQVAVPAGAGRKVHINATAAPGSVVVDLLYPSLAYGGPN
jgi:hypothetical protein